jgi:protein-S-isoprenylcysteine O-methyltransferase Ste14
MPLDPKFQKNRAHARNNEQNKIMPTTFFLVFLLFSIVLHFLFPIKKFIFPPYTYTGFILIGFGAILNIWTDLVFKKKKTTVKPYEDPTALITVGPFRISRHPMYLGMFLVLSGVAVSHGTLITFVFPFVFVVLMELLFIPFEEKNVERIFGEKYLDYKRKVRRWI